MEILSAGILGAVQGLTEFIPISSTGHLILVREFLGISETYGLAFDATLHLATALAVALYFWRDIWGIVARLWKWCMGSADTGAQTLLFSLILGTIPGALAGYFLEDTISLHLRGVMPVAIGLVLGSILFALAEKYARDGMLTARKGFVAGIFQALALLPGMSRSGSTISGSLLLGITREEAVRFSFLLSFPILFGAGIKKLLDLSNVGAVASLELQLIVGGIVAFIVGLLAIHFMVNFLKKHSLMPFVWYRILLALFIGVSMFF